MPSNQFTWQSNDGSVPLTLEVQREFVSASGLSPTVEIKRVTDEFYADWTDLIFKSPAASGDRFGSMSEVVNSPGVYKRFFKPLDFGQSFARQDFIATYRVTLPSGILVGNTVIEQDVFLTKSETHSFTDFVGSGVLIQQGMTAEFC